MSFRAMPVMALTLIVGTAVVAQQRPAPPSANSSAPSRGGSRRMPVQLDPASRPAASRPTLKSGQVRGGGAAELGDWSYRAERADPRDGVPWKLIATPLSQLAQKLKPSEQFDVPQRIEQVPVLRVPDSVWPKWFDADMKDVVGIHYHQFLADDVADLLMTIHKVPADGPDGKPLADYAGKKGSRLEATLLKPLAFHLDQCMVVRVDGLGRGDQAVGESRLDHERGHGALSLTTLLATLAGPADWDLKACTGRKSIIAWYWCASPVDRSWDGYHGGSGKLATLRTTIVLVPPTRWSMLIPLEPDDVTQRQIDEFNQSLVHLDATYAHVDHIVQKHFHEQHGEFETKPASPRR